jgi:hypothetical protein
MANPEATAVVEEKLRLPSRFELGAGLRYPVSPGLAVITEAVATVEVYGADTLDRIAPLDLLAGFQGRRGPIRLTAGVLYAAGSPPSGAVRPSPLAGFVDLSRASEADTRRYLEQGGLGGAAAHLLRARAACDRVRRGRQRRRCLGRARRRLRMARVQPRRHGRSHG